jgi:hypothetical protein
VLVVMWRFVAEPVEAEIKEFTEEDQREDGIVPVDGTGTIAGDSV